MLEIIILIIGLGIGYFLRGIEESQELKEEIKEEISDEEKEKYKQMKESFTELMEYDYDQALGSGIDE